VQQRPRVHMVMEAIQKQPGEGRQPGKPLWQATEGGHLTIAVLADCYGQILQKAQL
jgi:hypothetical protein